MNSREGEVVTLASWETILGLLLVLSESRYLYQMLNYQSTKSPCLELNNQSQASQSQHTFPYFFSFEVKTTTVRWTTLLRLLEVWPSPKLPSSPLSCVVHASPAGSDAWCWPLTSNTKNNCEMQRHLECKD